ncbi:uncharacterized protein [Triticum aestivum]|uniref:uncharacterized protein isoform X2 n=1 Tax=Triticum aestivum TaxID=4565 RepID=UPI001D01543B|nr:uncharacterized protein LOC123061807 isoform X2 [Triticum aestivum]
MVSRLITASNGSSPRHTDGSAWRSTTHLLLFRCWHALLKREAPAYVHCKIWALIWPNIETVGLFSLPAVGSTGRGVRAWGALLPNECPLHYERVVRSGVRALLTSTPLRRRLRFAPDAATATVAMDPVKSAELQAQLKEMRAELKERSLPGAKVTKGPPSEILPFLAEVVKKNRAELREAYSNLEPPILRLNSRQDPCASPPAFSEDGEGKEA